MHPYRQFLKELDRLDLDINYCKKLGSYLYDTPALSAYKKSLPIRGTALIQTLSLLSHFKLVKVTYTDIGGGLDLVVILTATGLDWVKKGKFYKAYEGKILVDEIYNYMSALGFNLHTSPPQRTDDYFEWIYREAAGKVLFVDLKGITSIKEIAGRMLKQQVMLLNQFTPAGIAVDTHAPPPINGTVK